MGPSHCIPDSVNNRHTKGEGNLITPEWPTAEALPLQETYQKKPDSFA